MRAALLAVGLSAFLLLAAAPPATAGHTLAPVPDGELVIYVAFIVIGAYAPAPHEEVDKLWIAACGATTGLPAGCRYTPRECTETDLKVFCR